MRPGALSHFIPLYLRYNPSVARFIADWDRTVSLGSVLRPAGRIRLRRTHWTLSTSRNSTRPSSSTFGTGTGIRGGIYWKSRASLPARRRISRSSSQILHQPKLELPLFLPYFVGFFGVFFLTLEMLRKYTGYKDGRAGKGLAIVGFCESVGKDKERTKEGTFYCKDNEAKQFWERNHTDNKQRSIVKHITVQERLFTSAFLRNDRSEPLCL
jgi:hypothetical protein